LGNGLAAGLRQTHVSLLWGTLATAARGAIDLPPLEAAVTAVARVSQICRGATKSG
jgi:hypothetical protein